MAMTTGGAGPVEPVGSDQPGQQPASLVTTEPRDVAKPIVVPNTLWTSTTPEAYAGGRASEHLHLAELEGSDLMVGGQRALGRPRRHPDEGGLRPRPDPDEQPVAAALRVSPAARSR